ncbi:MAG TPA: fumarylacetoacetate hydrolase family protein [Phycisphaerae bacterium]|nr:fumarylacetoacetate hydrolase family protein [Phycisphaerae bacterium]
MRIIRFLDSVNQIHHGVDQSDGTALRIQGDIFANYTVTHQKVAIRKILSPIVPAAIMCIGLNYRKHAEETGAKIPEFPVLFMKNPAAVQNPGDPIELPTHLRSTLVDWECELAIVIGKLAKNVSKENALQYVLGYTCANDVSARDWQKQWGGSQWCRGKTFDTFCPLGPAIVTTDEIPNPNSLSLSTKVNGETMQSSNTADMIFNVPTLISFLSGSTTLLPGTVILTGTPNGVGMGMNPPRFLKAGDSVTVSIEKIGELTNPVIAEPA